jgi:hypothetical protein
MVQMKTNKSVFMPYNTSINLNLTDWKEYKLDLLILNERNLFELKLNTSDAFMMGTEHSNS